MTVALQTPVEPFGAALGRIAPLGRLCLGILAVNAIAAALLHPSVIAATDGVPGLLLIMLWIAVVLAPLVAMIKALLFAATVWAIASLTGETVAWRRCVVTALVGEAILAFRPVFTAVVILLRGGASSPADLRVPQGLDLFVDVAPGWQTGLIEQSGIFHLIWIGWLFVGLRGVVGLRRPSAAISVACIWVLVICTSIVQFARL